MLTGRAGSGQWAGRELPHMAEGSCCFVAACLVLSCLSHQLSPYVTHCVVSQGASALCADLDALPPFLLPTPPPPRSPESRHCLCQLRPRRAPGSHGGLSPGPAAPPWKVAGSARGRLCSLSLGLRLSRLWLGGSPTA